MSRPAFPPGRDHPHPGRLPMRKGMGSAVESTPAETTARNLQLLRDCLALGGPGRSRPPAKVRLEAALGPELAQRLVRSLSRDRG